jgi:dethiobiotin synthetase
MTRGVVVAGIGTGIGKTLVAAILTEALQADYWKPVQAGNLDYTDTDFVKDHISNKNTVFHPETYRLSSPMSPHAAAKIDGLEIDLKKLSIPETDNTIIIEPAGGLMVPLNDKQLNIDLIQQWNLPVILVSQIYLGSINHTLLSVEALKHRSINLLGIIFNGERNQDTEEFILQYTGAKYLARIKYEEKVDKAVIKKYADELKLSVKIWL